MQWFQREVVTVFFKKKEGSQTASENILDWITLFRIPIHLQLYCIQKDTWIVTDTSAGKTVSEIAWNYRESWTSETWGLCMKWFAQLYAWAMGKHLNITWKQEKYNYRPRSRGDNTFCSVHLSVRTGAEWSILLLRQVQQKVRWNTSQLHS